jgi:hypothetical protein
VNPNGSASSVRMDLAPRFNFASNLFLASLYLLHSLRE